jgi:hypothetical protein
VSGTWSRTTLARTVSAGHRRFIDALRAGLQLRDQFPQHDIKVRPKDKARGIALKIAKLRELLAAGAVGRLWPRSSSKRASFRAALRSLVSLTLTTGLLPKFDASRGVRDPCRHPTR